MEIIKFTINTRLFKNKSKITYSMKHGNYLFVVDDNVKECDSWFVLGDSGLINETVLCTPNNMVFISEKKEGFYFKHFIEQFEIFVSNFNLNTESIDLLFSPDFVSLVLKQISLLKNLKKRRKVTLKKNVKKNTFRFLKKIINKRKPVLDTIDSYVMMDGSLLSGDNKIGGNTYIGFNCMITKSVIGRYCSIANNVSIGAGEHKIARVSTSSKFYAKPFETLTEKECTIGNDVWIGSNVVIRRGVTIGNGAVIGANSFVNKNVNDFEIFAGSPAKKIKMRFDENQIEIVNKSNWWIYEKNKSKDVIFELENTGFFEMDSREEVE